MNSLDQLDQVDTQELRTEVVRLDGDDVQRVSDAYDKLYAAGMIRSVDAASPLNSGSHPRSSVALDLATGDLAGVRRKLDELGYTDLITEHPPVKEDAWVVE